MNMKPTGTASRRLTMSLVFVCRPIDAELNVYKILTFHWRQLDGTT